MRNIIDSTDSMIPDIIPRIMMCHRDNLQIQENACTFLMYAFNTDRMLYTAIAPCFEAVVKTIQTHSVDPKADVLIHKALCAIDSMTRHQDTQKAVSSIYSSCNIDVVELVLACFSRKTPVKWTTLHTYEELMEI